MAYETAQKKNTQRVILHILLLHKTTITTLHTQNLLYILTF